MDTVEIPIDEIPLTIKLEVIIPLLLIFEEVIFDTVISGLPLRLSAVDAIPTKVPKNVVAVTTPIKRDCGITVDGRLPEVILDAFMDVIANPAPTKEVALIIPVVMTLPFELIPTPGRLSNGLAPI